MISKNNYRGHRMRKIISCCGVTCSGCEYYPETCKGCSVIQGKVFWLRYTNQTICDIYACCRKKNIISCALCCDLPCDKYKKIDPSKTKEENERILAKQLEQLKRQKEELV